MSKRPSGTAKFYLSMNEAHVLDALLVISPQYAMVDDVIALRSLLQREFVEEGERLDGEIVQPVYRITPSGAEAYGRMGGLHPLYVAG